MTDARVSIVLDGHRRAYRPGEILSGDYRLEGLAAEEIEALELSVLWFTEGKGDEDLAVHLFKRFSADEGDVIDPAHPGRFSTQLPASPLSYEGVIVKIRWCVRIRVFLHRARELMAEQVFRLGDLPHARAVLP